MSPYTTWARQARSLLPAEALLEEGDTSFVEPLT